VSRTKGGEGASRAIGSVAVVVLVVLMLLSVKLLNPFEKTPRDMVGLSYGGGVIEGAHFQGVKQPGSGLFFNGWGDKLYLYPVTQRNYIISKDPSAGDAMRVDFVSAPSSDRVEVQYEVSVYFKLNLSQLQKFHETIGLKYLAWGRDSEGWDRMLQETFRPQIEFAIQKESRKYAIADIYANPTTLVAIQEAVGSVLKENINSVIGDDYFCGPTYSEAQPTVCPDFKFVINSVTVPDSVKAAFESNRTSEIEIQTKKNEVEQASLEAQAIAQRQHALETCGQSCVLWEAIKSGQITFWVIPSDSGVNITRPGPG